MWHREVRRILVMVQLQQDVKIQSRAAPQMVFRWLGFDFFAGSDSRSHLPVGRVGS